MVASKSLFYNYCEINATESELIYLILSDVTLNLEAYIELCFDNFIKSIGGDCQVFIQYRSENHHRGK